MKLKSWVVISLSLVFVSIWNFELVGQILQQPQEISNSKPLGLGADEFIYFLGPDNVEYDTLIGNVKITQDSFFLFSNRAYVRNKSIVEAYEDVVILQGDSIQIFADSLIYNDLINLAELFGEVIFKNGKKELHTTYAQYDINTKQAVYNNGAKLFNENQTLISKEGLYDIDADQAYFRGNVKVTDSTAVVLTDSMKYDLSREEVYFITPTNITSDSTKIYCERGYYNYKSQEGKFYQNLKINSQNRIILADFVDFFGAERRYVLTGYPVIKEENRITRADTIVYLENRDILELKGNSEVKSDQETISADDIIFNLKTEEYTTVGKSEVVDIEGRFLSADKMYKDETGSDVAEKNVLLNDQSENIILTADFLKSSDDGKNYSAFNQDDQPLLMKLLDQDTLLLLSDTLTYKDQDSTKSYSGEGNISFLKGDISGKSGLLNYSPTDSVYIFTDNAALWSDSVQITGDSIEVVLKEDKVDELIIIGNAFLVMQNSSGTFEQVKGEEIHVHLSTQSEIEFVEVLRNVEMVYFLYEKGKLSGINHSLCGELKIFFENDTIDYVQFDDKPKSTFTKGETLDTNDFNLQGFEWKGDYRPEKSVFIK